MLTRIFTDSTHWTGIFLTLILLSPSAVYAKPGDLDPSFGVGGKQTTNFFSSPESVVNAIVLQPDGKIVAAGHSAKPITFEDDFALARYIPNGALDQSFGANGRVTTDFQARSDTATSLALQTDGKLVVAGSTSTASPGALGALARYNSDGSLDTGFGNGGKVIFDFGGYSLGMALQPDGKIVVVGTTQNEGRSLLVVARYNTNGTLDGGFGNGGKRITDFDGANDAAPGTVIIQPDGRIVAIGIAITSNPPPNPSFSALALARFNSDGALDASFGNGGKLTTSLGISLSRATATLQPDGKIVVATNDSDLVRYQSDGKLDTDFGNQGIVLHFLGTSISSIAIQADGKIVAAGSTPRFEFFNHRDDFTLQRYLINGSLDTSFGDGGRIITSFGDTSFANALALQPDGKIITAGASRATPASNVDFAVIRYLSDSGLPQPGWWWNPAQNGRGFTIEVQGDHLYFAGYLYDTSGRATWYTSGGPMTNNTSYTGTLYSFANGQTLTGNYKAPAPSIVGIINLQFTDATHGTLTWPGGAVPIERYVFGAGTASFQPENGGWWNESEGGRGFTIEVHGNTLFMGGYMYDDSGNPVWYASSGNMNSARYQGQWLQYANGQTLTGPYKFPDPPVNAGNVALEFTSRTNAMLTLPNGKQIALTRFRF